MSILKWDNDWCKVYRNWKSKSLPRLHKRGYDDEGKLHTLCGIRIEIATLISVLPANIKSFAQLKKFANKNKGTGLKLEMTCRVCQRVGR